MINVILSDTDNSKKGEANAIRASYWEEASSLQDNVHSWELNLIKCGVRNSLIPLLVNYLQDREH